MIYYLYKKVMYDVEFHRLLSPFTMAHSIMEAAKAFIFSSLSTLFYSSSSVDTDWAWLPENVLFMVLNKLLVLSDMIRFASVCSHWRSVAKDRFEKLNLRPNMHFNRNLPMLLLPSAENNSCICSLFSIPQRKIYDLHMQVPYSKRYCGSSHGWLIILDDRSFVISLVNPFFFQNSKGIIHLPPFTPALYARETAQNFNCERFVSKAILSSDPLASPNGYALMLIYGESRMLALWKSGDTHWTCISWFAAVFYDLVYSHGRFLVVDNFGQVYSCDIDVNPPQLSVVSGPLMEFLDGRCQRYIVELQDGTLLQVIRLRRARLCDKSLLIRSTVGFFFYELLDCSGAKYWCPVLNLKEGTLFLGDNCSLYLNASQFPGCLRNSVYFTDDFQESDTKLLKFFQFSGRRDIGVYHLPDKTIWRICTPLREPSAPPIWIIPTV